jgi:hypothetical protein
MSKLTVTSKHRSGVLQPQEVRLCQVYRNSRSFCNGRRAASSCPSAADCQAIDSVWARYGLILARAIR